jgi:glycine/D-amino acid oxidase-like deaminating enzyme
MPHLYQDTAERAVATPPLAGDIRADVAVVGGGFTGLSTALHLAEKGVKVVVLEAEEPGWGASGRNGGQVNPGLKHDPDVVERDFGADLGGRMNALAGQAPAFVFDLIERHGIACDARQNGTLRAALHPAQVALIRSSVEQLQRRNAPVEMLDGAATARATGNDRYLAALWDRRGGDMNPLSFARGLARAAIRAGAIVHGGTRVAKLTNTGASWKLSSATNTVTAAQVVLATNGYTDDLWPNLRRTIVPVFGAIAATDPLPDGIARTVMPSRAALYESGSVTVYYRVDSAQRLLIGGRGPQREIASTSAAAHLLAYALRLWPSLREVAWTHAWGGRLAMTRDQYPHIHEPARGVLVCLGFNGRGVALSTTLGARLAQRILTPAAAFDMPITDLKTIRLHALWPLGASRDCARATRKLSRPVAPGGTPTGRSSVLRPSCPYRSVATDAGR